MCRSTVLTLQGKQSPLYAVCDVGNIDMVKLLVQRGAEIDKPAEVSFVYANGKEHVRRAFV